MTETINVCPKCGSTKTRRPTTTMGGDSLISLPFSSGEYSECEECGYIGIFLIVDKIDLEEVQREIKKNKEA